MSIEAEVFIHAPNEAVWAVITDLDHAAERIGGIEAVEILERPESALVGLKWRETRTLFGKTATEVMWITDAAAPEFYQTRAESHGMVYISTLRITPQDGGCRLTMSHDSQPQGCAAMLMAIPFGLMFKGATQKAMLDDLNDIKAAVEAGGGAG